jgi:homoserine kinase
MTRVRVFVPGSIGNVGPGLDVLGLAVRGPGDTLVAERNRSGRIVVHQAGHRDLPTDPTRHASALAARAVMDQVGSRHDGMSLWLRKGLPLSGGQGGSAASAVAGAVAANALFGGRLSVERLLLAALQSESILAGHHLDNIAPALLGGLVLIRSMEPLDVVRLDPPRKLHLALVKPAYELRTKRGRAALPVRVERGTAIHQAAQVAAMVAAALQDDVTLFGRAIDDRIAEPARVSLLPGFVEAKRAALRAGALGCSISGSGPTLFAVAGSRAAAERAGAAAQRAYRLVGIAAAVRLTTPDRTGARTTYL